MILNPMLPAELVGKFIRSVMLMDDNSFTNPLTYVDVHKEQWLTFVDRSNQLLLIKLKFNFCLWRL